MTGYPFIEQHFDESMICELKEISLFPAMYMYSGYQKWSPFREFLDAWLVHGENTFDKTRNRTIALVITKFIQIYIIKQTAHTISSVLNCTINYSCCCGIFPSSLNISTIILRVSKKYWNVQ